MKGQPFGRAADQRVSDNAGRPVLTSEGRQPGNWFRIAARRQQTALLLLTALIMLLSSLIATEDGSQVHAAGRGLCWRGKPDLLGFCCAPKLVRVVA